MNGMRETREILENRAIVLRLVFIGARGKGTLMKSVGSFLDTWYRLSGIAYHGSGTVKRCIVEA